MITSEFFRITTLLVAGIGLLPMAGPVPASCAQESGLFAQDLTLHETTRITGAMDVDKSISTTNYFSRYAMKRTGPDGNDIIIRVDEARIINVYHASKTYSSVTVRELNEMLLKTVDEAGENKEQIEAMRKMMGAMMSSFAVTKIGPGEPIAGYKTEKYAVKGIMEMEIWAAPELKVPELYYDALKMSVPSNPVFDARKLFDEFKKIDGMTMKTLSTLKTMDKEIKTETVVTSVEKTPIPPSVFEIPAGYMQVAAEMLK